MEDKKLRKIGFVIYSLFFVFIFSGIFLIMVDLLLCILLIIVSGFCGVVGAHILSSTQYIVEESEKIL